MYAKFITGTMRRETAKMVHLHHALEASQIELDLPDATYKNDLVFPQALSSDEETPEGCMQKGERTGCLPLLPSQ